MISQTTVLRVLKNREDWPKQLAAGRDFVENERSWKKQRCKITSMFMAGSHYLPDKMSPYRKHQS